MIFRLNLYQVNVDGTTQAALPSNLTYSISINDIEVYTGLSLTADEATIDADTPVVVIGDLSCRLTEASVAGIPYIQGQAIQGTQNPNTTLNLKVVMFRLDGGSNYYVPLELNYTLNLYNHTIDIYLRRVNAPIYPTFYLSQDTISNSTRYGLTTGVENADVYVYRNGVQINEGAKGTIDTKAVDYTFKVVNQLGEASIIIACPIKRVAPQCSLTLLSGFSYSDVEYVEDDQIAAQIEMDYANWLSFVYDATAHIHALKDYLITYRLYRHTGVLVSTGGVGPIDIWDLATDDPSLSEELITPPDSTTDYYVQATIIFRDWEGNQVLRTTVSKAFNVHPDIVVTRNCNILSIVNAKSVEVDYSISSLQSDGTWLEVVAATQLAVEAVATYEASEDGVYQITFDDGLSSSSRVIITDCISQTCILNAAKALINYKPCNCNCKEDIVDYRFNFASLKQLFDTYSSILRVVDLDATYTTIDADLLSKLTDVKQLLEEIRVYCSDCGVTDEESDCGCSH